MHEIQIKADRGQQNSSSPAPLLQEEDTLISSLDDQMNHKNKKHNQHVKVVRLQEARGRECSCKHFFPSQTRFLCNSTIVYCSNCSRNVHCFDCITPSRPKSDRLLRKLSFSHRRIEKSDSTVLVPGNMVARTPQNSIRLGNLDPMRLQPSLNDDRPSKPSMACFKTGSER